MEAAEATVYSPASLAEALRVLHDEGAHARPLAGGTDAMVRFKDGVWRPRAWVNLLRLEELRFIRQEGERICIGALTTFAEILESPLLQSTAPLLVRAARTVGGPQIRNMATLGGNLGTASPAGDSLPALYALDARVRLVSHQGERELAISELFLGPGRTALQPGELIAELRFAPQARGELCTFEKLGLRAAHAISIASAAVRLVPAGDGRGLRMARVALGALAPTVIRVPEAEAVLAGSPEVDAVAVALAAHAARQAARPISDIRASASYRRAMAGNLVQRALVRLLGAGVMPAPSAA